MRANRLVRWCLPVGLAAVAGGLLWWTSELEREAHSPYPVAAPSVFNAGAEVLARARVGSRSADLHGSLPLELPLERGQTVGAVLADLDLGPRDAGAIVAELSEYADLRKLKPDDSYAVELSPESNAIAAFELTLAGKGRVRVVRADAGWSGEWSEFLRFTRPRVVRGELEGALDMRQPAVSQQLARLRADNSVTTRRDGKNIIYSLASEEARTITETLCALYLGRKS